MASMSDKSSTSGANASPARASMTVTSLLRFRNVLSVEVTALVNRIRASVDALQKMIQEGREVLEKARAGVEFSPTAVTAAKQAVEEACNRTRALLRRSKPGVVSETARAAILSRNAICQEQVAKLGELQSSLRRALAAPEDLRKRAGAELAAVYKNLQSLLGLERQYAWDRAAGGVQPDFDLAGPAGGVDAKSEAAIPEWGALSVALSRIQTATETENKARVDAFASGASIAVSKFQQWEQSAHKVPKAVSDALALCAKIKGQIATRGAGALALSRTLAKRARALSAQLTSAIVSATQSLTVAKARVEAAIAEARAVTEANRQLQKLQAEYDTICREEARATDASDQSALRELACSARTRSVVSRITALCDVLPEVACANPTLDPFSGTALGGLRVHSLREYDNIRAFETPAGALQPLAPTFTANYRGGPGAAIPCLLVQISGGSGRGFQGVRRSAAVYGQMLHPFVAKVRAVCLDAGGGPGGHDRWFIELPLYKRTLRQWVDEARQAAPDGDAWCERLLRVLAMLLRGLDYLHAKNLVHGRLSPDTVWMGPPLGSSSNETALYPVIWGFPTDSKGIDRKVTDGKSSGAEAGPARAYVDPRVKEGTVAPSPETDMYSFGVIFAEALMGRRLDADDPYKDFSQSTDVVFSTTQEQRRIIASLLRRPGGHWVGRPLAPLLLCRSIFCSGLASLRRCILCGFGKQTSEGVCCSRGAPPAGRRSAARGALGAQPDHFVCGNCFDSYVARQVQEKLCPEVRCPAGEVAASRIATAPGASGGSMATVSAVAAATTLTCACWSPPFKDDVIFKVTGPETSEIYLEARLAALVSESDRKRLRERVRALGGLDERAQRLHIARKHVAGLIEEAAGRLGQCRAEVRVYLNSLGEIARDAAKGLRRELTRAGLGCVLRAYGLNPAPAAEAKQSADSGDGKVTMSALPPTSSLTTARCAPAVCVSPDGEWIFAVGGFDAQDRPLATVEAMNTNTGQWSVIGPQLHQARGRAGVCVSCDGSALYAVGGSCPKPGEQARAPARHPGRIGAAPNGISRNDGQDIIWASNVHSGEDQGYTFENFRQGWEEPLTQVYQSSEEDVCTWTCCGGAWDSEPCEGGGEPSALSSAEVMDLDTGAWSSVPSMKKPRDGAGVVSSPDTGHIYAVGGLGSDTKALASGERLDVVKGEWTPLPRPMATKRFAPAVALSPEVNCLYVIGGSLAGASADAKGAGGRHSGRLGAAPNGISRSDGQEIMWSRDVESGESEGYTFENFRQGWSSDLATVYRGGGGNRCLWSCCERPWDAPPCEGAGSKGQCLSTIEAYDVKTETWSEYATLPQPVTEAGAAVSPGGEWIYVAGGSDGESALASVFRVNTGTRKCETLASGLSTSRRAPGVCLSSDGKYLYVVGGSAVATGSGSDAKDAKDAKDAENVKSSQVTASVEVIDLLRSEWVEVNARQEDKSPAAEPNTEVKASSGSDNSERKGRTHPGRIGAAPNGVSRSDGKEIMWSEDVNSGDDPGYTFANFRDGWSDPLETVYRPRGEDTCTWTCCGGRWDSPGCE